MFLLRATIAGLGISRLPNFIASRAHARGELVQVLPQFEIPEPGVCLVRSVRRRLNRRTRLFSAMMTEACASGRALCRARRQRGHARCAPSRAVLACFPQKQPDGAPVFRTCRKRHAGAARPCRSGEDPAAHRLGMEHPGNICRDRCLIRAGWGGRIRTYDTRYQKPLPYHLATPQQRGAKYAAGGGGSSPDREKISHAAGGAAGGAAPAGKRAKPQAARWR